MQLKWKQLQSTLTLAMQLIVKKEGSIAICENLSKQVFVMISKRRYKQCKWTCSCNIFQVFRSTRKNLTRSSQNFGTGWNRLEHLGPPQLNAKGYLSRTQKRPEIAATAERPQMGSNILRRSVARWPVMASHG